MSETFRIVLDSQWLKSAENQLRLMYYSPWYVNFGQIFHFSEIHPNVDLGSEENSAKISVKHFASFWIASGFKNMPKMN